MKITLMTPVAAALLMGCGGGGTTNPPVTGPDLIAFAQSASNTSFPLQGTQVSLNFDSGVFSATEAQDVSVQLLPGTNGQFAIRFSAFGEEFTLDQDTVVTAFNEFQVMVPAQNATYSFYTNADDWSDVFAGNAPFSYVIDYGVARTTDTTFENIGGVVGLRTPVADVPMLGGGSFTGRMFGVEYSGGPGGASIETVRGDLTMEVSFQDAVASGRVSNIARAGAASPNEAFVLDEGAITGGAVATTLSVDTAMCGATCPTIADSAVSGNFYGPAGEEFGASIRANGLRGDGNAYTMNGALVAAQ